MDAYLRRLKSQNEQALTEATSVDAAELGRRAEAEKRRAEAIRDDALVRLCVAGREKAFRQSLTPTNVPLWTAQAGEAAAQAAGERGPEARMDGEQGEADGGEAEAHEGRGVSQEDGGDPGTMDSLASLHHRGDTLRPAWLRSGCWGLL